MILLEICCDDVAGAAIAEQNGAHRVELCADLAHGGTTPSLSTVSAVLASISTIDLQVLIRQRPGDFVYSSAEVDAMVSDIAAIRALVPPAGVTVGFVIGALTQDGRVDVPTMERLLLATGLAPVTFHRAFDSVTDQEESLEDIIELGIDKVLTSGGHETALEGIGSLANLVEQAETRISVLAAGSIRAHNVAQIVRKTAVDEVHLRANVTADSSTTSPDVVRDVVTALAELGYP